MKKEEFIESCEKCKTHQELDNLCQQNILLWSDTQDLAKVVYETRKRITKETGKA